MGEEIPGQRHSLVSKFGTHQYRADFARRKRRQPQYLVAAEPKMNEPAVTDLATLLQQATCQSWPILDDRSERSYRLALGKEVIQLGIVEFRILLFLASRPYHAFSRRSIADAVSSEQDSVREDTVDRHVASLLGQLGVFHDYVQSVPYIGYRFKA